MTHATRTDELNASECGWKPMENAPRDGTEIVVSDSGGESTVFWSHRPVCMLGERNGGFPAGWATGQHSGTDYNLPIDEPDKWKPLSAKAATDEAIERHEAIGAMTEWELSEAVFRI